MKNKKSQAVFALLFIGLFFVVIQISGCDSTKGSNIPSSPSGNTLTLSKSPTTSIAADGFDFVTITATVTGNLSGTVTFITSFGTLSASSVIVNSNGEASVTLSSSTAGIATVQATAGTVTKNTTVTFGVGTITISGTSDVSDTSTSTTESTTITFTVTDVNSNTVAGLTVTLATPTTNHSSVTGSWSSSSPSTNSSGVATSILTTNSADIGTDVTVTFTASATGMGDAAGQVIFKQ